LKINSGMPRFVAVCETGEMKMERVFRVVVACNLVLVALSCWPRFEGTAAQPGVVDHLLGALRLRGFRADVVWHFSRNALYRALSKDGNPESGTVLKVMHALGVKLSATMVA
jgi:hypothetical protein